MTGVPSAAMEIPSTADEEFLFSSANASSHPPNSPQATPMPIATTTPEQLPAMFVSFALSHRR